MRAALIAVGTVWILGCVWSYQEQSAFAASKGFTFPHLLPLVIDGLAVSMAGVSWAASLDARAALSARLATVVAIGASAASNGVWAYLRAHQDMVAMVLGVSVPVAANLAFEVLLAELRRQVQRRRGLPPPVAVPYPRLIRVALAPWQTFRDWRTLVLEITTIDHLLDPVLPDNALGTHSAQSTELSPLPATQRLATRRTEEIESTQAQALPDADRTVAGLVNCRESAFLVPATHSTSNPRHLPPAGPGGQGTQFATTQHSADSEASFPMSVAPRPTARPITPSASPADIAPPAAAVPDSGAMLHDGAPATGDTTEEEVLESRQRVNAADDAHVADTRIAHLVQYLINCANPHEVTGEMVGPLLDVDLAPRTGRRLLAQARAHLSQTQRVDLPTLGDREPSISRAR